MLNPRLRLLDDYPFDRLRALLDPIAPPAGLAPTVLSIGEPRHAPPSWLAEVLARETAGWGRYPPVDGTPAFRRAAAGWLRRRYRLPDGWLDPDQHLLPVAGTREALFLIAAVAVPPALDQGRPVVLMPDPFYQVYYGAAVIAGGEPVFLAATAESGFLPNLNACPKDVLARTALAYLCSPANPQGAVAGLDFLCRAIEMAREHDFLLVCDECYAEIYDERPPPGALQACHAMGGGLDHVLVFHSLSKRSSVPGLRSGFVAGDPQVVAAFRRLRAFGGAAQPLPILAAAAVLWDDDEHVAANRALYHAKLDRAAKVLGGRFGFYRPQGGFFLWLDVGDGENAARRLWAEEAIRVLPGRYLAKPGAAPDHPAARYIRVALVDDLAATEHALSRLAKTL
jgi:N-succinyldiaminopimelate aminotransferase